MQGRLVVVGLLAQTEGFVLDGPKQAVQQSHELSIDSFLLFGHELPTIAEQQRVS